MSKLHRTSEIFFHPRDKSYNFRISPEDGEILVPDDQIEAEMRAGRSTPTTPTGIRKRKITSVPPHHHRLVLADSSGIHRSAGKGAENINDVMLSRNHPSRQSCWSVSGSFISKGDKKATEQVWHTNEGFLHVEHETEELTTKK